MAFFGKYEVLEQIGKGATATVYRAKDNTMGREVALKVFDPALVSEPVAFARFVHEAQASANLFHENIATALDSGEVEGKFYIAMRFIPGVPLGHILREQGSLPWEDAFKMVHQVGSALAYAHSHGFLHRDVKPANIIQGIDGNYVLTDFGLAKALLSSGLTTHTGSILGTPSYIPPEIWDGKLATPATDVYALACLLFEALTGGPMFSGETPPAVMGCHFKERIFPSQWPEGVPTGFTSVLGKALTIQPAERYQTVAEFSTALDNLNSRTILESTTMKAAPQSENLPVPPLQEPGTEIPVAISTHELPVPNPNTQPVRSPSNEKKSKSTTGAFFILAGSILIVLAFSNVFIVALDLICLLLGAILVLLGIKSLYSAPNTPLNPYLSDVSTNVIEDSINNSSTSELLSQNLSVNPTDNTEAVEISTAPVIIPAGSRLEGGRLFVRLAEGVEMEFIRIPAGEFMMGAGKDDPQAGSNEKPQHLVTLDEYWIGRYPVTNLQYATFINKTGKKEPKHWRFGNIPRGLSNHPVIYVSWLDARAFCDWLSAQSGQLIRLPTEAEWEKAARGTDGRIYPWGIHVPNGRCNYGKILGRTTPVGKYSPIGDSPYGCADMVGNVWEWALDWYGPYSTGKQINPIGPEQGEYRVRRGSSWRYMDLENLLRVSTRGRDVPTNSNDVIGFRCAH